MVRMRFGPALLVLLTATFAAGTVMGCAGDEDGARAESDVSGKKDTPQSWDQGEPDLSPDLLAERPWEVLSKKGETLLANVFYAEASENEQIMPWTVDGRAVIDRLVYPTIGNPNLYVKSDPEDELTVVLRVEDDALAHLAPKAEGSADELRALALREQDGDELAFFLVPRNARPSGEAASVIAEKAGVVRIRPSRLQLGAEPADMPAALKKRRTVRATFGAQAMANVPPGLYDVRFEVRKGGKVFANVFEWQYNAVRVFESASDEYEALNVSDTQVSVATVYKTLTADKIDDFVDAVLASPDPKVRNASFITFNGDLHNGGSPETIRQQAVAQTYQAEAKRVLAALKRLPTPIFLTAGNHDGYAALGHVPDLIAKADRVVGVDLQDVVAQQNNVAWPDFSWSAYSAFLDATKDGPRKNDLYTGGFSRRIGQTFGAAFREVPRPSRNMVLYDGFHQWQKTYGPLYGSWTFGKNRYVSVNSFELRQHHRVGWGMYTVNYGGGIGRVQMDWIDRELGRAKVANQDVVMLMHHDPRGGHKGKDHGYYFPLLKYEGMSQSTVNYLLGEVFTPYICKKPDFALNVNERESCLHDGLQEWMGPDQDFEKEGSGYFLSGVELLKRVSLSPRVRTMLLGHAHFNTLEVLQPGDVLVPNRLALGDGASQQRTATLETANPVRRFAWEKQLLPGAPRSAIFDPWSREASATGPVLGQASFDGWRSELDGLLRKGAGVGQRAMDGANVGHEVAIVRLTSAADLSSQTYGTSSMFGWSVLHVTKQTDVPRINRVTYLIHQGPDRFDEITTVDIDRTKRVGARDQENPLDRLFDW